MGLPDLASLTSARTSRTYPVEVAELARAVEGAVRRLKRWEPGRSREGEIRAVRRTRLGFEDDVTVRLAPLESGASTNTHARFESASRVGAFDLGQNRRNLDELLAAVDRELRERVGDER